MPPEEVMEWWAHADADLRSAQVLLANRPPLLDTACFHCQQAAEKALKNFLVWNDQPFMKVHSLGYLIDLCAPIHPEFEQYREPAEALTPYAINLRYLGEAAVTLEEAKQSLSAAESILAFIRQLIPIEP